MISYGVMLALALMLNMRDLRMFWLCLVVGGGIFLPIPDAYFYLNCALVELTVAFLAYLIATNASKPVVRISIILMALHGLGWWLNGYPPESPYHVLVRLCEHAELIACIVLSHHTMKERAHHA